MAFTLFLSCGHEVSEVNGSAFEVLPTTTYNKLQQKYSSLESFEYGTARVKNNNGWGVINTKGKEVIKPEYDTIYPLIHNYRVTEKSSKYGLINIFGKVTIPCKYDEFSTYMDNGYFPFKLHDKWGFVSEIDDILVQFIYDSIALIEDSVFVAKLNGFEGLFDYTGKTLVEPQYDRILYRIFSDGNVSFAKKGDNYAIINSKNELVSKCEYSDLAIPHGEYLTISSYNYDRFCLVNWETGEVKIPYGYDELGDYNEGVIYACKNDKYGYINPDNKTVIPFIFDAAEDFSEGLALVGINKGYYRSILGYLPKTFYGFIDIKGNWVIEPTFPNQFLSPGDGFKEGFAVMGAPREDNIYPDKYGYIDKTGKWVIKPIYKDAQDFENGIAIIETNNGYGAINKLGEIIVEPKYKDYEPREWHEDKLVFDDENEKTYEYSLNGVAL